MDQDDVPDDIRQQWQEAQANRRMQFKVGDFKSSKIRMLTGTLKADWIQLPVERYLAVLPTLKQGWSAMIFTTYGRSMMCQVCGAMFAHVGDYCSSTLKPRGLDGTRWQKERRDSLPTDPINLGMTDDDFYAWSNCRTAKARLWRLRQPAPPLEFPCEQGILSGIYAQVREEEQVISLQFVGSQQDVSNCRKKKRKQVDDATAIA